ncbi:hypothetical protein AALP_AA6G268100 [Arabis alpina]|uniref:TF-B3 domain-containing protein n=1 Tax=Arabis alpina TaxID=50452 RepID=A0A087GRX6_ARAAL|nr:hypothetical protein AALP_AA6G268100 [Arabis alpina]
MAKSTLLRHPQFFHTLVPGFHTHLVIPVGFFSKYIQGKSMEVEDTVELKSGSSDITWKVKMTGQRFSDGWEDFAVANRLQIGDVLLVRYEGDLVFHVSDLGPNCSETRDIAPPSSNNDDDDDNIEFHRKKKLRKNCPEGEGEAGSSSSSDNSCFVATVTTSSLRTDTLHLPQHFTSSNGLTRKCCKIVLLDGGVRSWAVDLSFNNSSDTFYISQGWRNFCDENGQEAGGFFMFKLVGSGETLVLSFCPTESSNDRKQRDCSEASGRESISTKVGCEEENIEVENSEDECSSMESLMEIESSEDECSLVESLLEIEKTKYTPKQRFFSYSSYAPCQKRFVTFTLPPDYVRIEKLSLPKQFASENSVNKPGIIYLVGKDGTKWLTNLHRDTKGTMSLGKGWKDFVKANGIKKGFTLKLIWEDTTPVLRLCDAESTIDKAQEELSKTNETESLVIDSSNRDKIKRDENNKEESRSWDRNNNYTRGKDSTPSSENQLVTLTITPSSFIKCRLGLPKCFTKENCINKPGMITLLGKDGIKQPTKLLFNKVKGVMVLGGGWKSFVKENGLKTGDSFTLKLIWEDTTPVLSLCPAEQSIDKRGVCSETNQKKSFPIEPTSCKKISKDENIKDDNSKEKNNKEENSKGENPLMEREKTHLRGRDSTPSSQKQFLTLTITPSSFTQCRLTLPAPFVRENNMNKPGMIYLGESSSSKANEKESVSTEPRSRDSSSAIQNQFVTLTITPSSFTQCRLTLAAPFVRENDMNKPGMIYLVGKDGTKWPTNLQRDNKGTMSLGKGWKDFVKAHDLKLGDSFTMELIWQDTIPMLSWFRTESSSSKANEKESVSNEPRSRDSSSAIQNQFVTLALTPEDVKACQLHLPSQFMKANGINKLGKMTLLGENEMEWSGYLLTKDGTVALGKGWDEFCEANGVKSGEPFTLEFLNSSRDLELLKMANKHFFKPLLPGFHSHLTIPDAFFLKYIQGRNEQTMAKLRSDASKIIWEVKVEEDGQKLTDGWKEFALAHDLGVGDIAVFRQERYMAFHVTLLGPSCCEIQYESCLDNENNLEKIEKKKKVKKNPRTRREASSSLDPSCFVANVSRATLRYDTLYFPTTFTRANSLDARCGEIVLLNEKGKSWTLALTQKKNGSFFIRRGWRSFCRANGLKAGGFYTFKLIQRGGTPVLRLSATESEEESSEEGDEIESLSTESESDEERNPEKIQRKKKVKKNPRREAESSSLDTSCFVANVSPATLRYDTLNLPRPFVRANGLDTRIGEIVLMNEKESESDEESNQDEKSLKKRRSTWKASSSSSQNRLVTLTHTPNNLKKSILFLPVAFTRMHGINEETQMTLLDKKGVNWSTNLRGEKIGDRIRLVGGWKEFFKANSVKPGESVEFELIWKEDTSCVLKFCPE